MIYQGACASRGGGVDSKGESEIRDVVPIYSRIADLERSSDINTVVKALVAFGDDYAVTDDADDDCDVIGEEDGCTGYWILKVRLPIPSIAHRREAEMLADEGDAAAAPPVLREL